MCCTNKRSYFLSKTFKIQHAAKNNSVSWENVWSEEWIHWESRLVLHTCERFLDWNLVLCIYFVSKTLIFFVSWCENTGIGFSHERLYVYIYWRKKNQFHSGSSSKVSSTFCRNSFVRKLKKDLLLGGGPTSIGTWFLWLISIWNEKQNVLVAPLYHVDKKTKKKSYSAWGLFPWLSIHLHGEFLIDFDNDMTALGKPFAWGPQARPHLSHV